MTTKFGTDGDDTLTGGPTADQLFGLDGADVLRGRADDDTLIGGPGGDTLDGGAGRDTVSYAGAATPVTITAGSGSLGVSDGDSLRDIEVVVGSVYGDRIAGAAYAEVFAGTGDDRIDISGTAHGESGVDTFLAADVAYGGSGGDRFQTGVGTAYGGDGADTVTGTQTAYGGAGRDSMTGDGRANLYIGDGGADRLLGGAGADRLRGSAGDDTLRGEAGADRLVGGSGSDDMAGGRGDDTYVVADAGDRVTEDFGQGRDTVISSVSFQIENSIDEVILEEGAGGIDATGNRADNRLVGNDSTNTLRGKGNADTFVGSGGGDALLGGPGRDTVTYRNGDVGVVATLDRSGPAQAGLAEGDTFRSIENLVGTAYDDRLTGDAGVNRLTGGAGADRLEGGAGTDIAVYADAPAAVSVTLFDGGRSGEAEGDVLVDIENLVGSAFDDRLTGDGGANELAGRAGADTLLGSVGEDTATYRKAPSGVDADLGAGRGSAGWADGDTYSKIENLLGSAHADTLTGDAGDNVLIGNRGDDTLDGGAGTDAVRYRGTAGPVTVDLARGRADGPSGTDSLSNLENAIGGAFDDTLIGGAGDNVLSGVGGADTLRGGAGSDTAAYRSAPAAVDAQLAAGGQAGRADGDSYRNIENLIGSPHDDTLIGDGGANELTGGRGADTLNGAGGADTANYADAPDKVIARLGSQGTSGVARGDTYIRIEHLTGSAFDDVLSGTNGPNLLTGGPGADDLQGRGGSDTARYADAPAAVSADLRTGGSAGVADGDRYSNIDNLFGSAFDDVLSGDDGRNILRGGPGADALDGRGGPDAASYTAASAGVVADLARGGQAGVADGDSYAGIGELIGSPHADTLIGDADDNTLRGRRGGDTLDGGGGRDVASYVAAGSAVTADLADGGSRGDAAGDSYTSVEDLIGSRHADTLIGGPGDNVLIGRVGGDDLRGGGGSDVASYADAPAAVTADLAAGGSAGHATGDSYTDIAALLGSAFADTLIGDADDNTFLASEGGDDLRGAGGSDRVDYSAATAAVEIDLDTGGTGATAEGDSYAGIEDVRATAFDDTVIGNTAANDLRAGDGRDLLSYRGAPQGVTVDLAAGTGADGAAGDTYSGFEDLRGSANADTLIGGPDDNVLFGSDGGDRLRGGAGYDVASYAGAGAAIEADFVTGGLAGIAAGDSYAEIELLRGSPFADTLTGTAGAQWFDGGPGGDRFDGGAGRDTVTYANADGRVSADLLNGGFRGIAESDTFTEIENLTGSRFNDYLAGTDGDNVIQPGPGGDNVDGRGGTDTVSYQDADQGISLVYYDFGSWRGRGEEARGDRFRDMENVVATRFADDIQGTTGDNVIVGGPGADRLDGNRGRDTVSFRNSETGVNADLGTGTGSGGTAEGDTYLNVENLTGTPFADTLTGDAADNVLIGRGAGDSFDGAGGLDTVSYADATAGLTVTLADGGDTGPAAGDSFTSIERLIGSRFDDALTGGDGDDFLDGGRGGDTLDGGAGRDLADYSEADSFVDAHVSSGGFAGEAAGDDYTDLEGLIGTPYDDSLSGGSGDDLLEPGAGDDDLTGGLGSDTASYARSDGRVVAKLWQGRGFEGDADGDTYRGIENLVGSPGEDRLAGTAGANVIRGGESRDRYLGGGGDDIFVFEPNNGRDIVTNWQDGEYRLDLTAFDYDSFSDVSTLNRGYGFIVDLPKDGEVLIKGLTSADFDQSDVIL